MNYKKLISHINSKNWYRQGGAAKLLYVSYPYEACSHFSTNGRQIEHYYAGYVGFLKNDLMNYYFTKETAEKVCDFYLDRQKQNLKFLQNLKSKWDKKHFAPISALAYKCENVDISQLPTRKLLKKFEEFSILFEKAWRECIFLDAFDIYSEQIANRVLEKSKSKLSPSDLQILTSGYQMTWAQKAELELFGLLGVKSGLPQKVKKYSEKWYWLQNDYERVNKLDANYFFQKLEKIKKDRDLLSKEKQSFLEFNLNKKRRSRLIKILKKEPKAAAILSGLATLSDWRDSRKAFNQIADQTVKNYVLEIAKRTKIKLSSLENLFYWEIKKAIKNPEMTSRLIKSRGDEWLFTNFNNREIKIFPAKKPEWKIKALLDKQINQGGLKGSTAYPGLVKGKVKIINSQKDFHKMNRGDILVAPNTRPEYVPIMKLAGAIISEEGGITCHSAIVSRELKIPCIVGVQGATDQLKDGDTVEVDANIGIIKKL